MRAVELWKNGRKDLGCKVQGSKFQVPSRLLFTSKKLVLEKVKVWDTGMLASEQICVLLNSARVATLNNNNNKNGTVVDSGFYKP